MSAQNNGGPAFPLRSYEDWQGREVDGVAGMTLRDYFAAKAMPDVMAGWRADRAMPDRDASFDEDADLMAKDCYLMADAMLKAREQ